MKIYTQEWELVKQLILSSDVHSNTSILTINLNATR